MNNHQSKIAIYARKSTESEDRQILSIDSQVKELRDFARQQHLAILNVFTESKSAKSPGRPVFNDLMVEVQKGKFDELLCWKLDRLARNPVDGGALIWALEKGELTKILTPSRTFINTGNDKFWMQLEFGMAKKYVDDLSDNVKRGLKAKVNMGWMPGVPPLGYLNDRATKTIVKDPGRFPLVRKMWDLMLTGGYTPNAILKIATDRWGLRTRQFPHTPSRAMAYSNVYRIFTNPFYYGVIFFGNEYYQGAHPPMISRSEFDRVQELLGRSDHVRPKTYFFPYTGLIKCGECGASITAEHKTNRQGHKYVYYHCSKRKRSVTCSQKVIETRKLESQIVSFLESLAITDEFRNWAVNIIKEMREEEKEKSNTSTVSLRKRSDACKKELDELLNMRLQGLLGDSEYSDKKNSIIGEIGKIRELLTDTDSRFTQVLQRCEEAFDFACSVKEKYQNGTSEIRKAILCYTGSNLTLKDGILNIEARKPFFIIQKALQLPSAKKYMFEPLNIRCDKNKKQRSHAGLSTWLTAIKEVRTFYWENRLDLARFELPDILKSSKK